MGRLVRMGIDVGGTHTKAVATDNAAHKIIGKPSVETAHDGPKGVAAGVVKSFENCLNENGVSPDDVVFVAHFTTQATSALIGGDVATVGVIGMAKGGLEGFLTKKRTKLDDVDLGNQGKIKIVNDFINVKKMNMTVIEDAINSMQKSGAQVLVSSIAFGMDDGGSEAEVYEAAGARSIPTTMASDIAKLYGLTRRTRTAAINASILPKMLDTANSAEGSVREAGAHVSLMITRDDGGVMEITEMRKRPMLTMLPGPAASVMGLLMHLRASSDAYFEMGGTTTNIGAIRNGRPAIDYSIVGGHATYILSLDVRVLSVAGGSTAQANRQGVVDAGPRSAHMTRLDYAMFMDTDKIRGLKVEFFSPKQEDPDGYVGIRVENGSVVTLTNSCAADVLGLVEPEHLSYDNVESARKAMKALADYCGTTVEDIAEQAMEKAYARIEPVILELTEKYKLEKDRISLVGVGGGATSLIVYSDNKMGVKYSIPESAGVISSIGVTLSMVRDVAKCIMPSPSKGDIRAIKNEALNKVIESGATTESMEIHIEIDPQTSEVTATATNSAEVKTADLLKECDKTEARHLAAEDVRLADGNTASLATSPYFYAYGGRTEPGTPGAVRIVDRKGFIEVQRGGTMCLKATTTAYLDTLKQLWDDMAVYQAELITRPDYYLCMDTRIMDFMAQDFGQLGLLASLEVSSLEPDEGILVVAANIGQN